MDVGGATQWSMDKVFTKAQMLSTREEIRSHRGLAEVRFRAREPLQIAGRNNIRHHCFDHRAILCNL